MTIAAVYVSAEGVVLGADSTTTVISPNRDKHFYNQAQKLFEIGTNGTLGVVTWGLASLGSTSYRSLIARLETEIVSSNSSSVEDVTDLWIDMFWTVYNADPFICKIKDLISRPSHGSGHPNELSADEDSYLREARHLATVGFCVGGYMLADRTPKAAEILFNPADPKPKPRIISAGSFAFWGAPSIIKRIMWGCGDDVRVSILDSPHWTGTQDQLDALISGCFLSPPTATVPIRDAIDFVNFGILSTIKAFKFSNYSQICGGPVELAVITSDRRFRWVRHKDWDSAVKDGAA